MPDLAQQGNTDPNPEHMPGSGLGAAEAPASSSPAVEVLPVPPLQPEEFTPEEKFTPELESSTPSMPGSLSNSNEME